MKKTKAKIKKKKPKKRLSETPAPVPSNAPLKQGRPETTIFVQEDVRQHWFDNYDSGDFVKIKAATGISRPTIRRVWSGDGRASQETIDKITAFYEERKKQQQVIEERIKLATLGQEPKKEEAEAK